MQVSLRSGKDCPRAEPPGWHSKSCGCFQKETVAANAKHGHTRQGYPSPTYGSFRAMKSRCLDPNAINYLNYGGRGIKVCDRWLGPEGFTNFLSDLGERPEGMTIDRIDLNGNYEPSNTRWAVKSVQNHNQRKSKGKTSKYRGVSFINRQQKFVANIKEIHLGVFDSEIEAAIAYNEAAKIHFGAFANLNEVSSAAVN
jgi:hypothetical protein